MLFGYTLNINAQTHVCTHAKCLRDKGQAFSVKFTTPTVWVDYAVFNHTDCTSNHKYVTFYGSSKTFSPYKLSSGRPDKNITFITNGIQDCAQLSSNVTISIKILLKCIKLKLLTHILHFLTIALRFVVNIKTITVILRKLHSENSYLRNRIQVFFYKKMAVLLDFNCIRICIRCVVCCLHGSGTLLTLCVCPC